MIVRNNFRKVDMPIILGSRSVHISQSPITDISILRFDHSFGVKFAFSNDTELGRLRESLQQNNISADERDHQISITIQDTVNFDVSRLHTILSHFSNRFGGNGEISTDISVIFNSRGRILNQNDADPQRRRQESTSRYLGAELLNTISTEHTFQNTSIFFNMATPAVRTEVGDGVNAEKLSGIEIEIPDEYCCPLSLSVMSDPVYFPGDPTEKRFERSWITKWLNENRGIHPFTRAVVAASTLQADTKLKAEIDDFVEKAIAPPKQHGMI